MYANWLYHDDVNEYEYKTTEKKRLDAISTLRCAFENEERAIEAKRNEVKSEPFDCVTELNE